MTNCRLCSRSGSERFFSKYGYDIVRCKQCHLVYTDFKPTAKFLSDYYSKSYFQSGNSKRSYEDYSGESQAIIATSKKRIRSLRLPKRGAALDLGCAYGYFLSCLPKTWHKYGVEVSTHASKVARQLNPTATISNTKDIPKNFFSKKFDLITLWDVIEHLDKPSQILTSSYKLLKKGGTLALTTGDVDTLFARLQGQNWHLYNPPQHLSYFSANTITVLLKRSGFSQITITHPAAYYPLSYLLHKLKSLYHLPLPQPDWARHVIIPINLGDIMQVTAVK